MSEEDPLINVKDVEVGWDMQDESIPLSSITANEAVRIRMENEGLAALPPRTIPFVFRETVRRNGEKLALVSSDGKEKLTFKQYYDQSVSVAKSFIKLGMKAHECVSIIGFNSIEWNVSCVAAIMAGGFSAGIYTTNEPEAVFYIVDHSDSKVVICEGTEQLNKLLINQRKYTKLKGIVVWGISKSDLPSKSSGSIKLFTWEDFLTYGEDVNDAVVDNASGMPEPGHCASIIYTSGTTGPPKAAMISHDNITWTATAVGRAVGMEKDDRMLSFLPLSHIAAQILDIHGPLMWGYTIYFARPDALKGSLVVSLKEIEPTIFFGVPRVWEKIQEKMLEVGKTTTGVKKMIANWAKSKGKQMTLASQYGSTSKKPSCFGCANKIVFVNIKKNLGLSKVRMCISAAAPIAKDTVEYFGSLNLHIFELYGMSECTGPATVQTESHWKIGTVGPALPGTTLKLQASNNEIIYSGRHIFMGYLKMRDKTDESIDSAGFLHSGDIGHIDKDGFLSITGRIKELIKTSGGENIPPVLIEEEFKKAMPAISNCMVVGDRKKFLTILLCVKTKIDSNGVPMDELDKTALEVGKSIGSKAHTVKEVLSCPEWSAYFEEGMKKANSFATSRAQYINKWALLPVDFSVSGGELTATLKLKRSKVIDKYEKIIDSLYA